MNNLGIEKGKNKCSSHEITSTITIKDGSRLVKKAGAEQSCAERGRKKAGAGQELSMCRVRAW
jgi:hypothetical protein